MKWRHTARSKKDYAGAPVPIRNAFDKQARLLAENRLHPSLHAKKYSESSGVWQARVNRDWRFYFTIEGETYVIARIVPHPK
jgi:plasmid maintenance system killer protein